MVGSSNSIRDAITTISVTLQPNADLLPGEQVIIKDLLGSSTPSGGIMIRQVPSCASITFSDQRALFLSESSFPEIELCIPPKVDVYTSYIYIYIYMYTHTY